MLPAANKLNLGSLKPLSSAGVSSLDAGSLNSLKSLPEATLSGQKKGKKDKKKEKKKKKSRKEGKGNVEIDSSVEVNSSGLESSLDISNSSVGAIAAVDCSVTSTTTTTTVSTTAAATSQRPPPPPPPPAKKPEAPPPPKQAEIKQEENMKQTLDKPVEKDVPKILPFLIG